MREGKVCCAQHVGPNTGRDAGRVTGKAQQELVESSGSGGITSAWATQVSNQEDAWAIW